MKREWRELDREKYWGIEMRSILWIERVLIRNIWRKGDGMRKIVNVDVR